MKVFEISKKKTKNGKRSFRAILYRIYPDSCVDEKEQIGTMFNANGITWLRSPCEKALPSISGMSLRCEFTDEERTELLGHGDTDIVDGEPIYENAVVIGTFTKGYIEDVELEDGTTITACIGEGNIDAQCYHNFVTKLESDVANGIYPSGSIEIMHTENNQGIVYRYGYKDKGRIPEEFVHSGYALLGVAPADDNAKLIELNKNNKEELDKMNESEVRTLISQVVDEISRHESEINKCKEDCTEKIEKVNANLEKALAEKSEIEVSSQEIKKALETLKAEKDELDKRYDELWSEHEILKEELAKAQAKERIEAMKSALANFSEEEKSYAKDEIDSFKSDPTSSEINSIINKIWEGIGRNSRAKAVAEKNSLNTNTTDIFSEVIDTKSVTEDVNIF